MSANRIAAKPARLTTLAALLALAACTHRPPPPPPAPVEPAPSATVPLGAFADTAAVRAAWRARNPLPGQIGTGTVGAMTFQINAAGQIAIEPTRASSGPPLRPPTKPPTQ